MKSYLGIRGPGILYIKDLAAFLSTPAAQRQLAAVRRLSMTCKCFARCEADCVCDHDWTPPAVIALQGEIERLRAELDDAYAEIRKQVAGSKVVFDRDLVNLAKAAEPYNNHRIAWELERTAVGDGHYGNSLRVAKDIPGLTAEDRSLLDRYATGTNAGTDHIALQALALRIDAALAGGSNA